MQCYHSRGSNSPSLLGDRVTYPSATQFSLLPSLHWQNVKYEYLPHRDIVNITLHSDLQGILKSSECNYFFFSPWFSLPSCHSQMTPIRKSNGRFIFMLFHFLLALILMTTYTFLNIFPPWFWYQHFVLT